MVHAVVMKHVLYNEKNQDSHNFLIPSTGIWNFHYHVGPAQWVPEGKEFVVSPVFAEQ